MKLSTLLMTTALVTSAWAGAAAADSKSFSNIDTNDDDFLDESELSVAFGAERAAAILEKSDLDLDGRVSKDEIKASDDDGDEGDESDEDDEDGDEDGDEESDESDDEDDDSDESDDSGSDESGSDESSDD